MQSIVCRSVEYVDIYKITNFILCRLVSTSLRLVTTRLAGHSGRLDSTYRRNNHAGYASQTQEQIIAQLTQI